MILLDAYAIVALLARERAAAEVRRLLRNETCGLTAINLAEAVDVATRVHGVDHVDVRRVVEPLIATRVVTVESVTLAHAWRAASLRQSYYDRRERPLSLADCVLLASGEQHAGIATADGPVAFVARCEGIGVTPLPDSTGRRP